MQHALAGGDHALLELVMATHTGMTTLEFEQIVKHWIATARYPKTGKLYTQMVYEPMLELVAYLRANGFKTFIVSGGGIEFMRAWTEPVYGIQPEQVVGSNIKTKFEMRDGQPVLVRLPEAFEQMGPASISIRTSAPASRRSRILTKCWPNRLSRSPSRLRARPFTNSARSARLQRNSKSGI